VAGVRYVDAARSYGRAEEFLAGWRVDAPRQEVKEHSLAMFTSQLAESRALLGDRLALPDAYWEERAGGRDTRGLGARYLRSR
jgi:hypothetical protein